MITSTNCPSCGAPIAFSLGSSIVVICEFCGSAVARTDRDVKNLGKVADLVDTRSRLAVGVEGRFEGRPFVLSGRAQIAHPAGGVWDEWYASFGDGTTGWLAESQGRFHMTFRVAGDVPALSALRPGASVPIPVAPGSYVVVEVNSARPISAQGEIPYALEPGREFFFADLSALGGAYATIDYSETPPLLFAGREVTLVDIGISATRDTFGDAERHVGTVRLACPHCGGPMALRAPESERVTCPSCNALLDVNQGNLSYLSTLEIRTRPAIPLGSVGAFDEGKLTVIGHMMRWCTVEHVSYRWEEYLLYEPSVGFRWLVHDSGHWSYVVPLAPGDVFDGGTTASYHGVQYKRFQAVVAHVEQVFGEFYWRVEIGETTGAADFVHPPEILSSEGNKYEIAWSHGIYMPAADVASRFQNVRLEPAKKVGMAQPNPHVGAWLPWAILLAAAIVVGLLVQVTASRRQVFSKTYPLEAVAAADGTQVVFTDDFELQSFKNVMVELNAPVDNSWAYVEGDLVNQETGLVQSFSLPVEYYHGVDDGESWSEGGQTASVRLSALPAGHYTMRVEAQWERWQQPILLGVAVRQGVPGVVIWLVVLGFAVLGLVIQIVLWHSFEQRRWSESMFNTSSGD